MFNIKSDTDYFLCERYKIPEITAVVLVNMKTGMEPVVCSHTQLLHTQCPVLDWVLATLELCEKSPFLEEKLSSCALGYCC